MKLLCMRLLSFSGSALVLARSARFNFATGKITCYFSNGDFKIIDLTIAL